MVRLRALAAVLSCLAILAGGFAAMAAIAAPAPVVQGSAIDGQPCSHCDECEGVPCPMPAATCLQASSTSAPAIAAAMVELPAIDVGTVHWLNRDDTLSGLSPPPDPFPPRA